MIELLIAFGTALLTASSILGIVNTGMKVKKNNEQLKVLEMESKPAIEQSKEKTIRAVELKLENLNRLYQCGKCERYTRQHMMNLKMLREELETGDDWKDHSCPNCGENRLQIAIEDRKWMASHRHCFRMTEDMLPEYQKTIAGVRQNIEDAKELKSFEEYERKHLATGPKKDEAAAPYYNDIGGGLLEVSDAWREMGIDLDTIAKLQFEGMKERIEYKRMMESYPPQPIRSRPYSGKDPHHTVYFRTLGNTDTLITSRKNFEENKHEQGWHEIDPKTKKIIPSSEFLEIEATFLSKNRMG